MARSQYDVGAAPSDLPMERMLLVLKRSPEQQTALSKLLDDQQDKSSPSYHKWMTPDQFGQQFGPADSDIQAVTSWLQLHGLQVSRVTKGRTMVEFSGTAAQVKEALHTSIRKYLVKGEAHLANANDPEIPAALAPVVAGVHSLHNFYLKPLSSFSGERFTITRRAGLPPLLNGSGGTHALVPGDYSVIYNINPVYQGGIDGSGTTIAVVGRSNFFVQDVIDFQQLFALPFNPPQVIFDGADPGNLGGGEEAEALLDATWSGAVARGAAVKFVLSAGTDTTDGVVLSELYIIDNNVGDVMTQSFGGCEAAFTNTEAAGSRCSRKRRRPKALPTWWLQETRARRVATIWQRALRKARSQSVCRRPRRLRLQPAAPSLTRMVTTALIGIRPTIPLRSHQRNRISRKMCGMRLALHTARPVRLRWRPGAAESVHFSASLRGKRE